MRGAIRKSGAAFSVLAVCVLALLSPLHHARGADAAAGAACLLPDAASETEISGDGRHCNDGETGDGGGRHGKHGAATCLICTLAEAGGVLLPARGAELRVFFSQAAIWYPATGAPLASMAPERSARPRGPPVGT